MRIRSILFQPLAVLAIALPSSAMASDNSCYIKQRDLVLKGMGPDYTVTKELFVKMTRTDGGVSPVYVLEFKKGNESWRATWEFNAPQVFSQSPVTFSRTIDHLIDNKRDTRAVYNVSFASDCNGGYPRSTTFTYQPVDATHIKVIYDTSGVSTAAEHTETIFPADQVHNTFLFDQDKLDLARPGRLMLLDETDQGYSPLETILSQSPSARHLNSLTGSLELMPQSSLQIPGTDITFTATHGTQNYMSTRVDSGGQSTVRESVPKDEWMNLVPVASLGDTTIPESGFEAADEQSATLRYKIEGTGPIPVPFNGDMYFDSSVVQTGEAWTRTVSNFLPQAPHDIPWNSGILAGDIRYLRGSRLIQLDKVTSLVNEVRARLTPSTTRTQAAKIIAEVVNNHVHGDGTSMASGIVDRRTTENILKGGTGVCQHFATVFAAVARALNIPTRIVSGYLIYAPTQHAVGHTWNEIKLGENQWWPIDSLEQSSRLVRNTHLPAYEDRTFEYEADTEQGLLQETVRQSKIDLVWLKTKITELQK